MRPEKSPAEGTAPRTTPQPAGPPPVADLPTGYELDQFYVLRILGRGGMGAVYEAEDTLLRRRVAIKVLPGLSSDAQSNRLLREARAVAKLDHPNVVGIRHVGRWERGYYLVLELMTGGSLQQRIGPGRPLPWRVANRAVADACRGLVAAHAAELIHRDIKPGNLMCGPNGTVKIADFGLVRGSGLSGTSYHLVGTPSYMSPEQCRDEPADERSDVYSLGATYFALLTGRPPYATDVPMQAMFAHCTLPIPDPRAERPDVPEACVAVIRKAMAKAPTDRYQTAAEMLAALTDPAPDTLPPPAETFSFAAGARPRVVPPARVPVVLVTAGVVLVVGLGLGVAASVWSKSRTTANTGGVTGSDTGSRSRDEKPAPSPAKGGEDAPRPADRPAVLRPAAGVRQDDGWVFWAGGPVAAVGFSPDGRLFAAGSIRRKENEPGIIVWNRATREPAHVGWPGQDVRCLLFSPDSKGVVLGGDDGAVMWDLATGREFPYSDRGHGAVQSVAMTNDNKWIALGYSTGTNKGRVLLFDYQKRATGPLLPQAHTAPVRQVVYSPRDSSLAVLFENGDIWLWNPTLGPLKKMDAPKTMTPSRAIAFAPDRLAIARALWREVSFWGLHPGGVPRPQGPWTDSEITALAYTPGGCYLVVGELEGAVTLWDVRSDPPKKVRSLPGHGGPVTAIAISADGRTLATGSTDSKARLSDLGKVIDELAAEGKP